MISPMLCRTSVVSQGARELGTDLATIAAENAAKLADRKARGVLGGSGDNR